MGKMSCSRVARLARSQGFELFGTIRTWSQGLELFGTMLNCIRASICLLWWTKASCVGCVCIFEEHFALECKPQIHSLKTHRCNLTRVCMQITLVCVSPSQHPRVAERGEYFSPLKWDGPQFGFVFLQTNNLKIFQSLFRSDKYIQLSWPGLLTQYFIVCQSSMDILVINFWIGASQTGYVS